MATTPVLLPEVIPRTEEPGRLQSMGSQESDTTERRSRGSRLKLQETEFSAERYVWQHWQAVQCVRQCSVTRDAPVILSLVSRMWTEGARYQF